ncbi:hypothetical protein ACZ75_06710 [Massilia sp. NR 4-1]|nr:hypothetical protein ACZ75_06710 [Massilia sp. NR 4-1]
MTAPSSHQPPHNPDPLNQAAQAILPPDASYGSEAPLVSLLRLGLESGLLIKPASPACPDQEQVIDWIDLLSRAEHKAVAAFLNNPERLSGEECYLSPEMLMAAKTAEEAAAIVLDALVNSLIVRRRP